MGASSKVLPLQNLDVFSGNLNPLTSTSRPPFVEIENETFGKLCKSVDSTVFEMLRKIISFKKNTSQARCFREVTEPTIA
jgi:hypothetical protein